MMIPIFLSVALAILPADAAVPEASRRETVLAKDGRAEAVIVHPAGRRAE